MTAEHVSHDLSISGMISPACAHSAEQYFLPRPPGARYTVAPQLAQAICSPRRKRGWPAWAWSAQRREHFQAVS